MLSKVWMSLAEYTKLTMEGLKRGDVNIVTPSIETVWEKLEKPKIGASATSAFWKKD